LVVLYLINLFTPSLSSHRSYQSFSEYWEKIEFISSNDSDFFANSNLLRSIF
jgi:hypothetical protein